MLEFRRFDAAKCRFPRPGVALLPTLNWADLTLGRTDTIAPSLLDDAGIWHFARGRYALAAAYRLAGVGPAGALLAPAYHCRTMLDPAMAAGSPIRFYALNGDLTPNIDSIMAEAASRGPAVKALLVPHYFGFEQPAALMRELAELCAGRGIVLIEDCSHAWQAALQRGPACQSKLNHLVVASPYKFFACADGGILWGNPSQVGALRISRPGILTEARAIKAAFENRPEQDRLPSPGAEIAERGDERVEFSDQPSSLYSPDLESTGSLAMSRWVMRRTRLSIVAQRRRQHYRAWTDAVRHLKGGRALFSELPPACEPYMFPLLISAPDPQFLMLKQLGVPIWRWDEMAVSPCPVASEFRLSLLHLPCHQSLTAEQMDWMTSSVARVLS